MRQLAQRGLAQAGSPKSRCSARRVSLPGGVARRRDGAAEAVVVDGTPDSRGGGGDSTRGDGGALMGHCPPVPHRHTDGDHPPATGPGNCLRGAGPNRPAAARHPGTGVGRHFAAVGYGQCKIARGGGWSAAIARPGPITIAAQSGRGPPLDHGPAGLPAGRRRSGFGTSDGGSALLRRATPPTERSFGDTLGKSGKRVSALARLPLSMGTRCSFPDRGTIGWTSSSR